MEYTKQGKLKGRKKKSTLEFSKKKRSKAKYKKKKKKGKKKKAKVTTDGMNENGIAAANEAQARINVEKKAFTKKLNEEMKKKIADVKASMEGMSDTEKEVAAETIRQQYKDIKSKATKAFKQKYTAQLTELRKNKDYMA